MIAINVVNLVRSNGSGQIEGSLAPNFGLPELESGRTVKLSDYQGKVVLIDFWATWCPPCRKQMPALQELLLDASVSDGLQILSVNTDENKPGRDQLVSSFLRTNGLTMTTLLDNGSASGLYRVSRIPTLVVVRPDGVVHHVSSGVHDADTLRQIIAKAHQAN
ncbi:MAG: TlpA family protein disulfide reductase [Bradymonadaceae bacterium]|nr:TlpA family protein disulfide reductase [Lujinxingiaceae bacterium]